MNRYQIYLNSGTVSIFDNLADELNTSRSRIIQDVLDRIAIEYKKILNVQIALKTKNNPLLKMAGFAKSKKNNLSKDVDSIYK
ncbi:hypothetical protein KKC08_00350 [Patescibacteria group bacterium]|nr:hypothetical protein [Patescibacteria group bacterium]MCG2701855.1 hypothetical protein [Candidatus Parcubacteria bacterium]MBU4210107.1 hypothetical protein [Patescibacteria group bacterium]MBU4265407.1 hypothetical protein [Patescibacteria group bacterium]MBU4390359.1 hypothetical protein [Patescibacteria group bacterium]